METLKVSKESIKKLFSKTKFIRTEGDYLFSATQSTIVFTIENVLEDIEENRIITINEENVIISFEPSDEPQIPICYTPQPIVYEFLKEKNENKRTKNTK